jgi:hypothetical protein
MGSSALTLFSLSSLFEKELLARCFRKRYRGLQQHDQRMIAACEDRVRPLKMPKGTNASDMEKDCHMANLGYFLSYLPNINFCTRHPLDDYFNTWTIEELAELL